jgi:stage V sporulation protein G
MAEEEKFSKKFFSPEGVFKLLWKLYNYSYEEIRRKVSGFMNITDVRLKKVNSDGKMKAIASITIDDSFVVRDIRVIEGQNGLFVAMPSRKTPEGEFRDIAHPITSEARELIQNAILKEYETSV